MDSNHQQRPRQPSSNQSISAQLNNSTNSNNNNISSNNNANNNSQQQHYSTMLAAAAAAAAAVNQQNHNQFLDEHDEFVHKFELWSGQEQVEFVERLLSKMAHCQHRRIDAALQPMLERDFIQQFELSSATTTATSALAPISSNHFSTSTTTNTNNAAANNHHWTLGDSNNNAANTRHNNNHNSNSSPPHHPHHLGHHNANGLFHQPATAAVQQAPIGTAAPTSQLHQLTNHNNNSIILSNHHNNGSSNNNGNHSDLSSHLSTSSSSPVSTAAAVAAVAAAAAAVAANQSVNSSNNNNSIHQFGTNNNNNNNNNINNNNNLINNNNSTNHLTDPLGDLSAKLINSASLLPIKSQCKRQKMIYHCKFGEFGVMEGQFTEPSGVAVNAQNDIIVADTNNHRIQIFDNEGRFKFQFGECGKRDGQLLYPNRVAVVKSSGDIIVTERSPTHQIQVYTQYGQFVRKFGANILQHPRGVTVDNKGRIIVVECKVMRVIIFDQMGNVSHKFGCSKHLEFPNGVVVNDKQEIFISDNRAHCVKVFSYEGHFLRQIGGEGLTNYPIGVCINDAGEILVADNHNNFNITIFNQDGTLMSALESKVKHAQCFDVALMDDNSVVLASKDYRIYIYRYLQMQAAMTTMTTFD